MTMDPNPPQQPRGFLGGIFGGQQRQPDPNAGSPTDPFANLSRAQRTMLGFAALRDAAASLEGRDSNYFNSALGGFEAARERERLRAQGEMTNRVNALQSLAQIEALARYTGDPALAEFAASQRAVLLPTSGGGVTSGVTTGATPPVTPAGGVPGATPGVVQSAEDYQRQRAEVMGPGGPGVNADGTVFETPEPVVTPSELPTEAAPTLAETPAPEDDPIAGFEAQLADIARQRAEIQERIVLAQSAGLSPIREQEQLDALDRAEDRIYDQINTAREAQPEIEAARLESEDAARQARYNRSIIQRILEDENLSGVVGRIAGQTEPGTARGMVLFDEGELNVLGQIDQLRGQVFLEARDMLRGGGQITDFEGLRGEQALARIGQRGTSLEGYRQALRELDQIFANAEARARGQDVPFPEIDTAPEAGGGAGDGLSEEDQALIDRYTR